jgi:TPR repeat protein
MDAKRVSPGVFSNRIDVAAALAACRADLASDPHNPRLMFSLGRVLEKDADSMGAAKLYKAAADQGYAAARVSVAVFHWTGKGGLAKDLGEASRQLALATKSGEADAMRQRRHLYMESMLAPDPDEETVRFLHKMADQNDTEALYALAVATRLGLGSVGKERDEAEEIRLYKRASDLGCGIATQTLGVKYFFGRPGLPKDPAEAMRLFKLAAASSDRDAQMAVGISYEVGSYGMPQDAAEAASLYERASEQGLAAAQFRLGRLYEIGWGGLPKDEREAARLFSLAADQDDHDAEFAFAMYALDGRGGVAASEAMATALLRRAAAGGNGEAKEQLKKMDISP